MVTKNKLIIVSFIILCAGGYYWYTDEEKKVKKRFAQLEEYIFRQTGEKPLFSAQKTNNIKALFANPSHIQVQRNAMTGDFTPRDISQKAAVGRHQFSKLSLKFYDITIAFPDKQTAKVYVTARLTGTLKSGDDTTDAFELACVLRKTDGRWLFVEIIEVEVLEK